jgi:hypothetical protein
MSTDTQQPTPAPAGDLREQAQEPQCPDCGTTARWAGSPADSGFLAYCPSCDSAFHVTVTGVGKDGEIRLP